MKCLKKIIINVNLSKTRYLNKIGYIALRIQYRVVIKCYTYLRSAPDSIQIVVKILFVFFHK